MKKIVRIKTLAELMEMYPYLLKYEDCFIVSRRKNYLDKDTYRIGREILDLLGKIVKVEKIEGYPWATVGKKGKPIFLKTEWLDFS